MAFGEIFLAGYSGQSRAGKIAPSCPLRLRFLSRKTIPVLSFVFLGIESSCNISKSSTKQRNQKTLPLCERPPSTAQQYEQLRQSSFPQEYLYVYMRFVIANDRRKMVLKMSRFYLKMLQHCMVFYFIYISTHKLRTVAAKYPNRCPSRLEPYGKSGSQ